MTELELQTKLNRMTGEIPAETHRAFLSAALSGKEGKTVKKKITATLVLAILTGLAVIGTAYAMFSSQVADFFGRHWNQELGASLQEGKIAQIGESVTIGDVIFTLDEVVYQNRGLYGVGTARPVNENDVILPMDLAELPEYFLTNEEAQTLAAKAKAAGGSMLTTCSMPLKIGVDGGTLLMPGCIGYYDIANEDGSVTFSFDASDGFAVNEGTSYQIQMESRVSRINENGEITEGTTLHAEWTVSCVPVIMSPAADKTGSSGASPAVIEQDGYELLVPEVYQETGTMPVYRAEETDFTSLVRPEWFNHSGIASGEGTNDIHFADHAVLDLSPEALFYSEFTDDSYTEAASSIIAEITWVRDWTGHRGEFTLERTALSGITLKEAEDQAEELIARLGMGANQYVLTEVLDMSLEKIQAMGAIWERAIADGELLVDDDYKPYDYASIPHSEEGYYLCYNTLGVDTTLAGGRYGVNLYINSRGIVYANIRNRFYRGEMVETPKALISADAAIERLTEELGRSLPQNSRTIRSVQQAALTYEAVRAENKADGMVFVPVWLIRYQDESAVKSEYSCYALINAVNGTLIDASFR